MIWSISVESKEKHMAIFKLNPHLLTLLTQSKLIFISSL